RQPLPAVQYQPGPLRLRTALQLMAGPAWQLEVDDVQRVVCHSLRDGYQLPVSQLAPVPVTVPFVGREPGVKATGGFLKK
ncbi:TPA: pilus assembly protein PilL, partial [Escherichia coli]|nr:pilus assembly protein PilL [Escherichia coli]